MFWLWYILIGLVAGWLGSLIVKGSGSGMLLNIILGIVGGLLGGFLFGLFGFSTTSMLGSLITSVVGAVILIFLANLITRRR